MVVFSAEMLHVNGVSAAITLNDEVNANRSAMSLFIVSAEGLILGRAAMMRSARCNATSGFTFSSDVDGCRLSCGGFFQ